MQEIQNIYNSILAPFPLFLHPFISFGLAIFLIYSIVQVLKKNFIFLIALIILLPASIPIIKQVGMSLVSIVKFLLKI
jgi:hypothetical protein